MMIRASAVVAIVSMCWLSLLQIVKSQQESTTSSSTCTLAFTPDIEEATPRDSLGPFYIENTPIRTELAPADQLADPSLRLTVNGTVYGVLNDDTCQGVVPLSNVLVEPWYAGLPDAYGNTYSKEGSETLDYRGRIYTNECGHYEYISTFPESYAGRPIRHIHYRISNENRELLVTQQYFEDHIPSRYNPDARQITPLIQNEDGSRSTTFDIYVSVTKEDLQQQLANDPLTATARASNFDIVLDSLCLKGGNDSQSTTDNSTTDQERESENETPTINDNDDSNAASSSSMTTSAAMTVFRSYSALLQCSLMAVLLAVVYI